VSLGDWSPSGAVTRVSSSVARRVGHGPEAAWYPTVLVSLVSLTGCTGAAITARDGSGNTDASAPGDLSDSRSDGALPDGGAADTVTMVDTGPWAMVPATAGSLRGPCEHPPGTSPEALYG